MKFYRIKDVQKFNENARSNHMVSNYINGRIFQIDKTNNRGSATSIKIVGCYSSGSADSALSIGYDVWFTEHEISTYLEEVLENETGEQYIVVAYEPGDIVTNIAVKKTLDDAKETAKLFVKDNNTVVITKTILTAKKDIIFE